MRTGTGPARRPDRRQGRVAARADMPRLVALDGLRAVAAVLVVLYHLGVPAAAGGWVGVDVFFVLSGYLITTLLIGEFRSSGRVDLRSFWVRRFARLYPALLLMVGGVWLLAPDRFDDASRTYAATAALALTYTTDLVGFFGGTGRTGFTHTWSLAVEEQFYLLWPLVVVLLRGRTRPLVGVGLVATGGGLWALRSAGPVPPDHVAQYFLPTTRGWEILAGCLLAFGLPRLFETLAPGTLRLLGSVVLWSALPAGAGVVLFCGRRGSPLLVAVAVAVAFSAVLVAGIVLAPEALPARVLAWAPLAWLGRVSYGLYLYHWVVVRLLAGKVAALPDPARWTALLAASVAVAALSYHLVENPVQRAVRRLLARRAPSVADGAAVEASVPPFVVRPRRSEPSGAEPEYTPAAGFSLAYATRYAPTPVYAAAYPNARPPAPETSGWVAEIFPPAVVDVRDRVIDVRDRADVRPASSPASRRPR